MTGLGIRKWYVYLYSLYLMIGIMNHCYITKKLMYEDNYDTNTIYIYYAGAIIGNIFLGIIAKMGHRLKNILANILIFISCIPLTILSNYISRESRILYPFIVMYAVGSGMLIVIVPYYLLEMLPDIMRNSLLAIITGFIGISSLIESIIYAHLHKIKVLGRFIMEIIPSFLSFFQLVLALFVFRYETPKKLLENSELKLASNELSKIYNNDDIRLHQYKKLQQIVAATQYQYPSYYNLLSKKYIGKIFIAIVLLCLRNITIMTPAIDYKLTGGNAKMSDLFAYYIPAGLAIGSVISVFLIKCIRMYKVLLYGSAFMVIMYCIMIIVIMLNKLSGIPNFVLIIQILGGVCALIDGFSMYNVTFIFALKLLPERGFTCAMIFHWASEFAIAAITSSDKRDDKFYEYCKYLSAYAFATLIMIVFCYFVLKNYQQVEFTRELEVSSSSDDVTQSLKDESEAISYNDI